MLHCEYAFYEKVMNFLSAFAHFCTALYDAMQLLYYYNRHIVVLHTCVVVCRGLSAVYQCLGGSGAMKYGTDRRPFIWRKSPSRVPRHRPQQEAPGEATLLQSHRRPRLKITQKV